jgi:hypothetical protein
MTTAMMTRTVSGQSTIIPRPSRAPSTDIAGVIAPSPMSSEQPNMARRVIPYLLPVLRGGVVPSLWPAKMHWSNANVPPSPW